MERFATPVVSETNTEGKRSSANEGSNANGMAKGCQACCTEHVLCPQAGEGSQIGHLGLGGCGQNMEVHI